MGPGAHKVKEGHRWIEKHLSVVGFTSIMGEERRGNYHFCVLSVKPCSKIAKDTDTYTYLANQTFIQTYLDILREQLFSKFYQGSFWGHSQISSALPLMGQ